MTVLTVPMDLRLPASQQGCPFVVCCVVLSQKFIAATSPTENMTVNNKAVKG